MKQSQRQAQETPASRQSELRLLPLEKIQTIDIPSLKSQQRFSKSSEKKGGFRHTFYNGMKADIRGKCNAVGCKRRSYRKQQCKQHFTAGLMKLIRNELRNMYRGPDKAYAALDFTGVGHITEADFLASPIVSRVPCSREDLADFFVQTNAFEGGGMNFDSFKKTFFPHLYLIQDDSLQRADDQEDFAGDDDVQHKKRLKHLIAHQEQHQEQIHERLKKLERSLRDRFASFDSVRKAFLGLDTDYDGYITVEDILRYFGQDSREFNFNDLTKLIAEKDSSGKGRLGYADFSRWVGSAIHQSEGFYFRHDSIKNPQFEQSLQTRAFAINERCKQEAGKQLISVALERIIVDKIKFQWKTIRKAFSDMNKEKDSAITEEELRFYMQHWGLNLTDAQFAHVFRKFDHDCDGLISYADFHKAVGSEIHPGESLYFRQDKPHMMRINKCQHAMCWQPTQSLGANYCALHTKMYVDQGMQFFQRLLSKVGLTRWPAFLNAVRGSAERDDEYKQIFFDAFASILDSQFGVTLSKNEKRLLMSTFPGRNEGDKVRIDISKLYDVHYNNRMKRVYRGVHITDSDMADDAADISGYIGVFHRSNTVNERDLEGITMVQLAQMFFDMQESQRNQRLAQIMRTIKQIDQDHNGYVTSTELDDILKLSLPVLTARRLKPLFREFESLQNKILIDYKRFRDKLQQEIRLLQTREESRVQLEAKKGRIAEKLLRLRDSSLTEQRNDTSIEKQWATLLQSDSPKGVLVLNQKRYTTINAKRPSLLTKSFDQSALIRKSFAIPTKHLLNKSLANFKNIEAVRGSATQLNVYKDQPLGIFRRNAADAGFPKTIKEQRKIVADMNDSRNSPYISLKTPIRPGTTCSTLPKHVQSVKGKLQHEWKNIFRQLSSADTLEEGSVPKKRFDETLQANGVYISNEELTHLDKQYGSNGCINFVRMSDALGLNSRAMDVMRMTHSKINRLKSECKPLVCYDSGAVMKTLN